MDKFPNMDSFINFYNLVVKGLEDNQVAYIIKIDNLLSIVVEERDGLLIKNKEIYGCLED